MRSLRPWNSYIVAGTAFSAVCGTVAPMMFLIRDLNGQTADPAAVDVSLAGAFNRSAGLGMLGTLIPWALWQYAAAANLRQRAPGAQRHSPGRGVAMMFIPVVNAFILRRVLDDLWRGSAVGGASGAPSRAAAGGTPAVSLWLAAWISAIVIGQMDGYMFSVHAANRVLAQSATVTLASLLRAVAGACAIVIVVRITAMQESWPWADPDAAID